jgi:hypothetical protein
MLRTGKTAWMGGQNHNMIVEIKAENKTYSTRKKSGHFFEREDTGKG